MAITTLPTPPSRANSPADFAAKADALLSALPNFVTEANALADDVTTKQTTASSAAATATTKAGEASDSALAAASANSAAQIAKTAAESAAAAVAASYDAFDDRYLGAKSADPTVDNDGNALQVGALYWNTAINRMKCYSGADWKVEFSDAADVAYQPSGAGAVATTVQAKLREFVSINDYAGATANDKAAAMIADVGFVRFTRGNYSFTTGTLDAPLFFDAGAYITVPVANTLTITSRIESPRQWIFRGDGNYSLGHDADSGEDAREVHASWFGAFPYPGVNPVDQAPYINKAFASMGNGRESIVEFDVGNYTMRSQVTVTRGGWVKGAGTRRTVFLHDTDGFTTFVTNNTACKFSDIQFEIRTSAITNRVSPFISIQHNDAEVYNVNMGQTEKGVIINATNVRIDDLRAVYGYALATGSNLISVQGGGQISIHNVFANSSSFGPDALVHIGQAASATITDVLVDNVNYVVPSKAVYVDGSTQSIGRLQISNIRYNGFSGVAPENILHFLTGSAANMSDCVISDVFINGYATNGIRIEQNSSGTTEDLMFDNITINGSTGNGFEFVRTAGTLKDVYLGNNVDASERATPYSYSGNTSGFRIAPNALPSVLPAYCYDFTIADDGVAQINLRRSVFTGWLMITVGTVQRGIYMVRAASSPTSAAYGTPTANMATATTVLTGTTGTDGNFTVGVTDGVIYLENRLGSSQRVSASLLTGVA